MTRFHHTRVITLLAAIGAPALWAQAPSAGAPKAPAAVNMANRACSGVYSPQWDSCVGVVGYPNGNVYRGEFHQGKREGLGMIVIRARGISDENNIMASEPNSIYAGEFHDDRINGHGIWLTPRAAYAGSFVNNIAQPDVARRDCTGEPASWTHCVARVTFADGNVYSGEFMRGVREGLGLLEINDRGVSDASGVRAPQQAFYVGQFKNGRLNGQGMITGQDGAGFTGLLGTFTDNVLTAPSRPSSSEPAERPSGVAAALTSLMNDPAEQRRVAGAAALSKVLQQNPCASAQFTVQNTAIPYKPLAMDDAGRITAGAWKQVVAEQGCGTQRQLNVLVSVDAFGRLSMLPLLPGNTRADALLQNDAVRYAAVALRTVPGGIEPNCNVAYVADTQFVEEDKGGPQPGARSSPWREIWTLTSCTQQMIVPMHFIPDANGTTIVAGPKQDIKVLPLSQGQQVKQTPDRPAHSYLAAALLLSNPASPIRAF